jgi:hypothetical protein
VDNYLKTYNDLEKLGDASKESFVYDAVSAYKTSTMYQTAVDAREYAKQQNPTIVKYQRFLINALGEKVPDNVSANHKCISNFFYRFITQENQYLLGKGIFFENEETKKKLGGKKFDKALSKIGFKALWGACSYGFFNVDHIDVFDATEFVPLWDEYNGALRAGIRFWQIDYNKPLRMTLYEEDGYTDFVCVGTVTSVLNEKRAYKIKKARVSNDPTAIYEIGENYDGFPIVPCFGNQFHQSELVGQRTQIDAYDLIKSGFANDLDDVQQIYWILKNAGGMDELDLARFVDALNRTRTALLDDGVELDQKTAEIPYQARESYLTRLENDLYNDAMALNVKQLASGNVTATAINAAYQQLDDKVDMFQSCIEDFVDGILELAGVEDTYRFQRSKVTNQQEVTQMVLSAAQYLDRETVLKLLPFINPEDIEGILKRVDAEESNRYELPIDDGNEDNNEDDNEGNGDNEDDGNDE